MTHGKRHQKKFRAGSLSRKGKRQNRENKEFDLETERIIAELKDEIAGGKTKHSITLKAAAAEVVLSIYEDHK